VEELDIQSERLNKRIHIALPVRITQWDSENRPTLVMACTYDISSLGARVTGLRNAKVGEIVTLERGRSGKFYCRIVWVGELNSPLHGQVGVETVELQKTMWDAELHSMDEVFDPVPQRKAARPGISSEPIRRCGPRFEIQGFAELGQRNVPQVGVKNLSEMGCLLVTHDPLPKGSNLKLTLKVAQYDLTVKGSVRHVGPDSGIGVEFSEIRKGDRQVLQFLLKKLTEQQFEQAFQLEV
jgi:hypothetical protein